MNRVLKPGHRWYVWNEPNNFAFIKTNIYTLYFKFVCLFLENYLQNEKEEYEWLQQSMFNFPGKEELKHMLKKQVS
ncbi:class I SAM-dependent methyltransferase [Staphylococcus aureus]